MQSEKSQTVPRKLARGSFLADSSTRISIRFARICVDLLWLEKLEPRCRATTSNRRYFSASLFTEILCKGERVSFLSILPFILSSFVYPAIFRSFFLLPKFLFCSTLASAFTEILKYFAKVKRFPSFLSSLPFIRPRLSCFVYPSILRFFFSFPIFPILFHPFISRKNPRVNASRSGKVSATDGNAIF